MVLPSAVLFVTAFDPAVFDQASFGASCLADGFYGVYGGGRHALFRTDESCLGYATQFLSEGIVLPDPVQVADTGAQQLVWIERAAVDEAVHSEDMGGLGCDDAFAGTLLSLDALRVTADARSDGQIALGTSPAPSQILFCTADTVLASIPASASAHLDPLLPPFWRARPIPATPRSYVPVPPDAAARVRRILDGVKYDSAVAALLEELDVKQMKKDAEYLSGEADESAILSRHSFSDGARAAAAWIKAQVELSGATCALRPFLQGFTPNVVCKYTATMPTNATVLLSAHYDSRGSFGSTRAPGGDDDGSGTTAILALSRAIAKTGVRFKENVELVLFGGEEQGLLGSQAYARELKAQGANITLMIQADMLAYHVPEEPPQLGLPLSIGTLEVTQLVSNLSSLYSPELTVGYTAACCSDHQSFWEQGFPATQVFERAGPIADPMYHNSGDLVNRHGYDLEQVRSIAKVQFATLLHAAGYVLP